MSLLSDEKAEDEKDDEKEDKDEGTAGVKRKSCYARQLKLRSKELRVCLRTYILQGSSRVVKEDQIVYIIRAYELCILTL